MKKRKFKKNYLKKRKFKKRKIVKERNPFGDVLLIDIIELVHDTFKVTKQKYLSLASLYENFILNKLYYKIDIILFSKYVKIIFPKYKNKRKVTKNIKVSKVYISKVIDYYCGYIDFSHTDNSIQNKGEK